MKVTKVEIDRVWKGGVWPMPSVCTASNSGLRTSGGEL